MNAADRLSVAGDKAAVLIESLPWLKRFAGEIIVVKFGGNAMVDVELQRGGAEDDRASLCQPSRGRERLGLERRVGEQLGELRIHAPPAERGLRVGGDLVWHRVELAGQAARAAGFKVVLAHWAADAPELKTAQEGEGRT